MEVSNEIELMKVLDGDLCSGCGACVGICPVDALNIDGKESFKPVLDESKCIECNLCYKVCPGKGWNPVEQATKICEREGIKLDLKYGPVINFYLGKAIDEDIHLAGASGGVGTSLLLYLVENNIVDAAAVVILDKGVPKAKITNDLEVIKRASGSKYSPVPLMKEIIKELIKNPRKIAITVIPCQMAAMENYLRINKLIERELIYSIGLFCGDLKECKHVEQIANSLNINQDDESKFLGWRCGEWPGEVTFKLKNGETKGKEIQRFLDLSQPFFSLHRCLMCPSRENWLSDLALADNHKGQTNETIIVARTSKGNELLKAAEIDKLIYLKEMDINIPDTFNVTLTKFTPALLYINHRKNKSLPVPLYDYDAKVYLEDLKKARKLLALLKYRLFIIARSKLVMKIMVAHPKFMEKTGHFLNRFPGTIPGLAKVKRYLTRHI